MEFINYIRKDVHSATIASTGIKNVKTLTGLKLNLEDGKNETTFSGLGSYLEIDVSNKGTSKKVKIPFFSAYKKDKFVNPNGFAFVNPLAKKIVAKVKKENVPDFDLTVFQTDTIAELNRRINLLGTTPAEIAEKTELESRRDNVITNAKKKDSDKLVREEIKYLEEVINNGANLAVCTNDTKRKEALKTYADQFERLMTLKEQLKTLTWSQKRGIRKLNNKVFKIVAAGAAAVLVAGGIAIGYIKDFPKNFKDKVDSWFNSPKAKATETVTPTVLTTPTATITETIAPTATITPTATTTSTPVPTIACTDTPAPRKTGYEIGSEMYNDSLEGNYNNFANYQEMVEKYGIDFYSLIEGYTFVEHAHEMDITGISNKQLDNYINNARTMVSIVVNNGDFYQLPLRQETMEAIQDCLDGSPEAGIYFVSNSCEAKEPLLDMLTVGEVEALCMRDQELLDFNVNVYYKEIEDYKNKIKDNSLEVAEAEINKIKKYGIYPVA